MKKMMMRWRENFLLAPRAADRIDFWFEGGRIVDPYLIYKIFMCV